MQKKKAFTLIELLVVISIIALLIGILLPALGAARRAARQMQNSTQVRGIQAGMVLFAQGNNSFYPGRDSSGAKATGDWLYDDALYPESRIDRLIDDNFFSLEYARSPSEAQTATTSYALLHIDTSAAGKVTTSTRNDEWKDTTNSEAVVISDRAVQNNGGTYLKSIHTTPATTIDDWRGSVGYNDNHVVFESTMILSTKYGSTVNNTTNGLDLLFNKTGGTNVTGKEGTTTATKGSDALMVWGSTDLIFP